jgi:hypothetical protein
VKVVVLALLAACSAEPAASSIVIRHVTIVDSIESSNGSRRWFKTDACIAGKISTACSHAPALAAIY